MHPSLRRPLPVVFFACARRANELATHWAAEKRYRHEALMARDRRRQESAEDAAHTRKRQAADALSKARERLEGRSQSSDFGLEPLELRFTLVPSPTQTARVELSAEPAPAFKMDGLCGSLTEYSTVAPRAGHPRSCRSGAQGAEASAGSCARCHSKPLGMQT